MNLFGHHLKNIPDLADEERDAEHYLRAFDAMIERHDNNSDGACDVDIVLEVAKVAIRFIADDAFRRGFESRHENIVLPSRQNTISHEAALDDMRRHGDPFCQTITAKLEESPGLPNQLTLHLDEVELPETGNSDGPANWSHRDLKLTSAQADFLTRGLNNRVHQRGTERTEFTLRQRGMSKWRRKKEGGHYYLGRKGRGSVVALQRIAGKKRKMK
ncbi:hypothetical protein [Sinorhizobium medicae]|uniref:hypothetical protein n=1 Tax=Sinorhizobium medicae TaxID=110321 RepID=UPI001295467E|nr:hypothetical protein [Sinorhizobium medicae]MDX0968009.1 hypothetical protein [Sinorhizobium medicae]MQV50194.1 hypothetical protein [Sinorhizobium medicae]MQV55331.1 hypothetical protein [Sinorhizobium medicae]MQV74510.1 hypothetical protein [Sinorhizobium medicae]WQO88555.1 hypothetical protein U8C37_21920 [Sinorhizobium medicae]